MDGFASAILSGDRADNVMLVHGVCWTRVQGRGGDDQLKARDKACSRTEARLYDVPAAFEAYGGPGDDLLVGRRTRDRLVGRGGTDTADGRGSRDVCRAEVRLNCERGAG